MSFMIVCLQMKVQVQESNNHKGKFKKKIREWVKKGDDICHEMWEDYDAME